MRLTQKLSLRVSAQVMFRECPECGRMIERCADHAPGCSRPPTRERRVGESKETNRQYLQRMARELKAAGIKAKVVTDGHRGWVERLD